MERDVANSFIRRDNLTYAADRVARKMGGTFVPNARANEATELGSRVPRARSGESD